MCYYTEVLLLPDHTLSNDHDVCSLTFALIHAPVVAITMGKEMLLTGERSALSQRHPALKAVPNVRDLQAIVLISGHNHIIAKNPDWTYTIGVFNLD